ncbi:MAG TPA: hypothetical protein ENJ28_09620 [Gammaproteobacteria bacterium]|nr:hypothetical protein [Gammaproteobacteria bacterium]
MIHDIATHLSTLTAVQNVVVQGTKVVVTVNIDDNLYTLEVNLGGRFPSSLPKIYLVRAADYGLLPHVCWEGEVCYNDGEGVCIDITQQKEIAEHALTKAIDVLSKQGDEDFYDEFEGYWNKQDTIQPVYSLIEPGDKVRELRAAVNNKNKALIAFLPGEEDTLPNNEYAFLHKCTSRRTEMRAFYLPLESCIQPPLPGQPIEIDILENIVDLLSDCNRARWDDILKHNNIPKPALYLLLSQPRPGGGRSLFGITVPFANSWLKNSAGEKYKHTVTPLSINHHTPEFLIQRSGGYQDIAGIKIAIIGAGSVGGRIAEFMAMCGIRDLTLIDGDIYSIDNLYRHVLDSRHVETNKAKALASQLRSHFPYISITTKPEFINDPTSCFDNYDVIIDVTGDPTFSRRLNTKHREIQRTSKPLLLTVWLEALGLGGHVVLSDGLTEGCLHCLYHENGKEGLWNQYAFIESGQSVTRNLTGCGGAFTPYSAMDAAKTAEMAARMLINRLRNLTTKDHYCFWRGDDALAKSERMSTSDWYKKLGKAKTDAIDLHKGCSLCRQTA